MGRRNDLGAVVLSKYCGCTNNSGAPIAITAAGTGDATAVTGATIDCLGFGSAVAVIEGLAALTAAKTISVAAEIQESADGSTWDTAEALYAATVMATGAGNKTFIQESSINLAGRKRYLRVNFTPDLSNTATDTAIVTASLVLGGSDRVPA